MSPLIKNGKLDTDNIYLLKLILLIITFIIFTSSNISVRAVASETGNEKGWVIVIDAGHGGKDPGALGTSTHEKNITLAIALKTGEYIKQNIKNVTVIYTRDNDSFVELRDRAEIANKNKADLFISIHANWAKSKDIQGTETYIMGPAKDQQNLEVAMKENEVIYLEDNYTTKYEGFDPKSEVSYIMFTVMQKVFQEQSTDLASKIQTEFRERADRHDRNVKQAGFWVLYTTTMPSVLVETGFITNPTEEKYLNSKTGQDYLASAIFRACKEYIYEIESKSVLLTGKKQNSLQQETLSKPIAPPEGKIEFVVQITKSLVKYEVKPGNFKGLKDVVEINSTEGYRYATGRFSEYSAAFRYRKTIEAIYPDAFVIAVKDNKIVPLQQALKQKNKK
jgi:N-acetylmuramoyl-L-alanine amidase